MKRWRGTILCILGLGPASVPTLIQGLSNTNERACNACLFSLGDLGPIASNAIPRLAEIAMGTNYGLSEPAIEVLSEMGSGAVRFAPFFAEGVKDTNFPMAAAFVLGRLGDAGVPALIDSLTNHDKHIRIFALAALQPEFRNIGPGKPNKPPDYSFRRLTCAYNLKAMGLAYQLYSGQDAGLAVTGLRAGLEHTDLVNRLKTVRLLGEYGTTAATELSRATGDENEEVRHAATGLLGRLGISVQDGAIIRGPAEAKRIALVFTGHEFGEGGDTILDELRTHQGRASFFFTGDFLRNTNFARLVKRVVREGHYLGPHSDKHLLYCPWDGPKKTLLTREEFSADLRANLGQIGRVGFPSTQVPYFLPPYEHYNQQIAEWAREMGLTLINFTPGTRSNADYTGEREKNFVSSQAIFDSIVAREREDANGLNGFLLLLHVGSGPGRADKFHKRFGELLDYLTGKGYEFVRVDELLEGK